MSEDRVEIVQHDVLVSIGYKVCLFCCFFKVYRSVSLYVWLYINITYNLTYTGYFVYIWHSYFLDQALSDIITGDMMCHTYISMSWL